MIPIVQRWAENIHIPKEQVMIPLSFASILGGTCTLIGTSTNLVVLGMLQQWRGADGASDKTYSMGLFDLGLYGIPCALTGMTYMLLASRALLPKGRVASDNARNLARARGENLGAGAGATGGSVSEDLIVGARLQPWSAAVSKTVAGSGLRGLPGLYLVSVRRGETLMRAVGPDFVLAQGDVLYFTGMVENLGVVCAEHGLEAVTAEHDESSDDDDESSGDEAATSANANGASDSRDDVDDATVRLDDASLSLDDVSLDAAERGGVSLRETSGGAAKTKKQKPGEKQKSANSDVSLNVPASVPEMSELMEIQMMARSQAIGGAEGGAWSEKAARDGKRTTRGLAKHERRAKTSLIGTPPRRRNERHLRSRERGRCDTTPRGAWSDGDGESDAGGDQGASASATAPRRAGSVFSNVFSNFSTTKEPPTEASAPGADELRRAAHGERRRTGCHDASSRRVPRGAGAGARPSEAAAEFASAAVAAGIQARRPRVAWRKRSVGSRGDASDASISSRGVSRDTEIARDAAARALGPPRVTVEPDPDVRDDEGGENGVEGVEKLEKKRTRTVLGVSAPTAPACCTTSRRA